MLPLSDGKENRKLHRKTIFHYKNGLKINPETLNAFERLTVSTQKVATTVNVRLDIKEKLVWILTSALLVHMTVETRLVSMKMENTVVFVLVDSKSEMKFAWISMNA